MARLPAVVILACTEAFGWAEADTRLARLARREVVVESFIFVRSGLGCGVEELGGSGGEGIRR